MIGTPAVTRTAPLTIVLAAGEGTRMRATLPKVMHPLAGRSMIAHVLSAVPGGAGAKVAAVIGPGHDSVAAEIRRVRPDADVFTQTERKGTAHAVLAARAAIRGDAPVLVVFGDTPLLRPQTLEALVGALGGDVAIAVLGFRPGDPTGYGRLIVKGDALVAIREEADANEEEKQVTLCNAGAMALAGPHALAILDRIGNANRQDEFYLTDAVSVAREMNLRAVVREADADEVRGVNTKAQLAEAEAVMQARLRHAAMIAGVTMIAPETVFLSTDTRFGRDVVIEPFVVIGEGVSIGDGAIIHAFSHLDKSDVGARASVGPYARLRPGTQLGPSAKIGNFVEIKAAEIGEGAKVNHLTYIGDAVIGANANIGAGTVTCNYDGFAKFRTEIGEGAFIGSNSSLIAPVKIGTGAYVGSGSVISMEVPDDALGVGRAKQVNKDGWASRFRALKSVLKKP